MQTMSFEIPLGSDVQDVVTGFKGRIDSVCLCLNGCIRYSVTPMVKDGGIGEGYWFDSQRIELLGPGINATKPQEQTGTGGPMTRSLMEKSARG